jgi:hypothetical protein
MLTCKTCHGARAVIVNGIELKRDVASGDAANRDGADDLRRLMPMAF